MALDSTSSSSPTSSSSSHHSSSSFPLLLRCLLLLPLIHVSRALQLPPNQPPRAPDLGTPLPHNHIPSLVTNMPPHQPPVAPGSVGSQNLHPHDHPSHPHIPSLVPHNPLPLSRSRFSAQTQLDFSTHCNASCYHRGETARRVEELEQQLAFETLYANGSRTLTAVDLDEADDGENGEGVVALPNTWGRSRQPGRRLRHRRRMKRQIYGADGRFNIRGEHFLLDYPFSTAVRISTGCTGVLVSQRHVLTAAHCVHDGKDYVKGARKLRVGFLIPPSSVGNVTATQPQSSSSSSNNNVNNHISNNINTNNRLSTTNNNINSNKIPQTSSSSTKTTRTTTINDTGKKPLVRWVRVKRTRVPKGWIQGPQEVSMDFDYALLELRGSHRRPFMRMAVAPQARDLAGKRIHFSGFDSDRPGELVYRFCPVEDESNDLIYQHCDARPGASGSGVYGRVWDGATKRWERKVIGIFSGHQWLEIDGENRDYNVAVRFTPLKFAQICYWVHGNQVDCGRD